MNKRNIAPFPCLILALLALLPIAYSTTLTSFSITPNPASITDTLTINGTGYDTNTQKTGFDFNYALNDAKDISFFYYQSQYHALLLQTNFTPLGYTYNETLGFWEPDTKWQTGLTLTTIKANFETFLFGSNLYLVTSIGSATPNRPKAYKYDTATEQWITNYDFNTGLSDVPAFSNGAYHYFDYGGTPRMIEAITWADDGGAGNFGSFKSFSWSSDHWINDDAFANDFNLFEPLNTTTHTWRTVGTDVFVKNGEIYALVAPFGTANTYYDTSFTGTIASQKWNGTAWVISDFNNGLDSATDENHWYIHIINRDGALVIFETEQGKLTTKKYTVAADANSPIISSEFGYNPVRLVAILPDGNYENPLGTGEYFTQNPTLTITNPRTTSGYILAKTYSAENGWSAEAQEYLTLIPTCSDGIKDGNEQGVDCGGNCQTCTQKYGNCVPVIKNGDEDEKIDVVFVGSGFPDLNTFGEVVDEMIDYDGDYYGLMSVEPFKSRKDEFNFWRVDVGDNDYSLEDYKVQSMDDIESTCPWANEKILLSITPRFNPSAIANTSEGIGGHKAFVLVGCEFYGGCPYPVDINMVNPSDPNCQGYGIESECGYSYIETKVSTIRAFVHEFGHSFGGLEDEYLDPAKWGNGNLSSGNRVNCDDNLDGLCGDKWTDFPDASCIEFCFWEDWYKPYPNSIMRRHWILQDDYKPVNEYELEKDINCSIYNDLYQTSASNAFSYLLELNYKEAELNLIKAAVILGQAPNQGCNYTSVFGIANLMSEDNEQLYDFNFEAPTESKILIPEGWFDENGDLIYSGDMNLTQITDDVNFNLVVPYFNNADSIDLLDVNENLMLSIDVSNLKPITYTLGYAGKRITEEDYNITYSLVPQPTRKIISQDYNILLGATFNS